MTKRDYIIFTIILIIMAILVLGFGIAIPCIFHELTGLYCPGCGATRAMIALSRGNIYQAIRYNSVIFIDIPAVIAAIGILKLTKHNKKVEIGVNVVIVTLIVVSLTYGLMRNIPAFDYLAPTQII